MVAHTSCNSIYIKTIDIKTRVVTTSKFQSSTSQVPVGDDY